MESDRWFVVALNATCFVLCIGYLLYLAHILPAFLRRRETPVGDAGEFTWHLVIPCLDEERVIEGTLEHLATTFPDANIWCVDDDSGDDTLGIVTRMSLEYPRIHVVRRYAPDARAGKGAALNAAYEAIEEAVAQGVERHRAVVGIVDAGARLDPHCLDTIAGETLFGDPRVGAVQVLVRVTTDVETYVSRAPARIAEPRPPLAEPLLVRLQDLESTSTVAAMQCLRRNTGSVGMGGNGQFSRLSALDLVSQEYDTPWHGALLEDFGLGLHILLVGFRNEYCHQTFVAQEGLTDVRKLVRRRSRWAQGSMQSARHLRTVMESPDVPLKGAIEVARNLMVPWCRIVAGIAFPLALVVNAHYAFDTDDGVDRWLFRGAWALLPLAILFGVLPYGMWGFIYRRHTGYRISNRQAVILGLWHVAYGYLLLIAVWWALFRIIRGTSDRKRTERLRLDHRFTEVTAGR